MLRRIMDPTFLERLVRLKDAFPPDKVRWRIMQKPRNGQTSGLAVAYLSMVDIEDHLDNVMGPDRWRCSYPVVGRFLICKLELKDDDGEWIGKEDGAADNVASNASDDDFDKDTKAVLSDSKKRACRAWGIGRYLATVEKPWVDCEQRGNSWIIAKYEYARLAQLVGGESPPMNQQHPAQQQQPQQHQYNGPPPGDQYQGGDRPPTSPRQQQQQHQGQGGYQNAQAQGQQQQGGRPPRAFTIPGGRSKGTPIADAVEADLLFWIDKMSSNSDPKYARSNQEWVAAAKAELARRGGNAGSGNSNNGNGGGYAPPANTQGPPARQDRPPPPNNGYQQRQQQATPQQQHQGPPPVDDFGYDRGDDIPF